MQKIKVSLETVTINKNTIEFKQFTYLIHKKISKYFSKKDYQNNSHQ